MLYFLQRDLEFSVLNMILQPVPDSAINSLALVLLLDHVTGTSIFRGYKWIRITRALLSWHQDTLRRLGVHFQITLKHGVIPVM